MYHLIIADDEYMIRESMANLVDWAAIGFQVVLVAKDGREVIQELQKRTDIQVILTDIQMPVVTGLDVAKYVWENHLNTRVVMISGYREFEYARQAIAYNVSHYLLKPIDLVGITDTFTKLREELDRDAAEKERQKIQQKELLQYKSAVMEKFFELAYLGLFAKEKDVQFYLKQFDLTADLEGLRVYEFRLSVSEPETDHTITREILQNMTSMLIQQYPLGHPPVILSETDTKYVLIQLVSPQTDRNQLQMYYQDLEKALHDICAVDASIHLGKADWELNQFIREVGKKQEDHRGKSADYLTSMAHQYLLILNMTPEIQETARALADIFVQFTAAMQENQRQDCMEQLFSKMAALMVQRIPVFSENWDADSQKTAVLPLEELFCRRIQAFYQQMIWEQEQNLSVVEAVK